MNGSQLMTGSHLMTAIVLVIVAIIAIIVIVSIRKKFSRVIVKKAKVAIVPGNAEKHYQLGLGYMNQLTNLPTRSGATSNTSRRTAPGALPFSRQSSMTTR